jgi:predicted DNA-binding transcriptional regulator AlpA
MTAKRLDSPHRPEQHGRMLPEIVRASSLPPSLPPRGLARVQAAEYIGVGTTKFDEMVGDGRMPRPKRIDGRTVWDRVKLDEAFAALDDDGNAPNEWDE